MKRIVFALTVLTSGSTLAADWQKVSSSDEAVYRMDFASVSTVGPYRKAWVTAEFVNAKELDTYPKKKYQSAKSLWYFDCKNGLLSIPKSIYYAGESANGEVVDQSSSKFDARLLDDVTPDTVGETIHKAACATPAQRARIKAKNAADDAQLLRELNEYAEKRNSGN